MTATVEDMALERIAIADLDPVLESSERVIEGVVTLIWPYSVSNKSFSMLLAEPDFRLRRQKGQVRIHFTGPSASAVSKCDPKSGDHVTLRLLGAQWEKDEAVSRTPGRGIDWQLRFEQRMVLSIQREDQEPAKLDIDHPTPSPEPRVRTPPSPDRNLMPQFSSTPVLPSTMPPRIHAWSTPAFLKRDRLSSTTFFGSDYDPIDEDEFRDNRRRKKTKFGRRSNEWRFTESSTSSESASEAETSMAQQSAIDESRNARMSSQHDVVLPQKSSITHTTSNAQSAEEALEITVTPGESKAGVNDRQIPPSTEDRETSQQPAISQQPTKVFTVDEDVQTVQDGAELVEYAQQGAEEMNVEDPAEDVSLSKASYRARINETRLADEQRKANSMSPAIETAKSSGSSEDKNRDITEVDDKAILNGSPGVESEPKHRSRRETVSPNMNTQALDEALTEKQMLAESLVYPEPGNDQEYQARQAAFNSPPEMLEPSDDIILNSSPFASNDARTTKVVEETEEIRSTIEPAQEPATPVMDRHPSSDDSRSTDQIPVFSPSQDQDFSSVQGNVKPDIQRSKEVEVLEDSQEDYESEGLPITLNMRSPDVVQESLVSQPKEATSIQDEMETLEKPSPGKTVEDFHEQAEIVEVLDESQGDDSSFEEDEFIEEERQRLPEEAGMEEEEETWGSEEESYPSEENPDIQEFDDEDEDSGEFNEPTAPTVPRKSPVEVILLDDSDEDDAGIVESQTDGAFMSIPPDIERLGQSADSFRSFVKEDLSLMHNEPFLRDTVPDSQLLPVSLELEPASEDADVVPDSTGGQNSPLPLDINDFEINEQDKLQITLPRGNLHVEDHLDPRLKNKVLTPNDTQPRDDISQESSISLRSVPDTHDLPTPQLTQNRSSDILLPASLRPSSPAIENDSSPPVSPPKIKSSPPNKGAPSLVEQLRQLRDDVHVLPKQSSKSRRVSNIPASVSPWFAPKRFSGVIPDSRSQSDAGSQTESEAMTGDGIYSSYDEDEEDVEDPREEIPSSIPEPRAEPSTTRRLFQRKSPDRSLHSSPLAAPPGLRTTHAYYAPLSTLPSHFNSATSTLSIVVAATPILHANSGPRDFYTTAYITDPSCLPGTVHGESDSTNAAPSFITTSIFRPSRSSMPSPLAAGSVLLLRSLKVTSTNRAPSLISTNSSAWAVFSPHNPDPTISGPPVEFGAEERGYVRGLWEWWDQLGAEVKADTITAAEEKVRKAVRKDAREREKGRRLKGMGLRLAPGNYDRGTGKHELRDGKEWKDEVGSPTREKIKGRGRKKGVRHELRDGKEWVDGR